MITPKLYNVLLYLGLGTFLAYDVAYFHEQGLPLAIIAVAAAGFDISSLLAELPSSVIFDRYSPRMTLFFGNAIRVAGFAIFALHPTEFWWVLVGQVLAGIGSATESGAAAALYVNSREDRSSGFEKILGELTQAIGFSTIVGGVIGALLYHLDERLIWLAAGVFYGAAALVVLGLQIPRTTPNDASSAPGWAQTISEMRGLLRIRDIWLLTALNSSALGIIFVWQIKLEQSAGSSWAPFAGLVAMNLGSAAAGFLGSKFQIGTRTSRAIILVSANVAACFFFATNDSVFVLVPAFLLHVTMQVWAVNFIASRIHQEIGDHQRATAFSVVSVLSAGAAAIIGPAVGFVADNISLSAGILLSGILYVLVVVLLAGGSNVPRYEEKEPSVACR